jgi:hypothetical protein
MSTYDDWRTSGPDETHDECLSDDDVKEAREEGYAEGRGDVASKVEGILDAHPRDAGTVLAFRIRKLIDSIL